MLNTDVGITLAGTSIINQLVGYIPIKIANATEFAVRDVGLREVAQISKTDRHEHFISVTIKAKIMP